mgnify:CR=1 FL=1
MSRDREVLTRLVNSQKTDHHTLKLKKIIHKIGVRPARISEISSIKNELDRLIAIEFALLAVNAR